jgi:signal transduction histidine kinase
MPLTIPAYALLGLTALVVVLATWLVIAMVRTAAGLRESSSQVRGQAGETALLSAALQEAVSRLKRQERETAARADASERLNSEIISSLSAGLLVADLDGRVRILNPPGRKMLGVADTAPLGVHHGQLGELALSELIDECLATRTLIARRMVDLPESRQGVSALGVTVSPLFGAAGEPHGAICLFTDLTAVKQLEEQLRLKESLAALGELTAGIAHEFRNGLATIQGYSKLLDRDSLPEGQRPYLEGIRAETESLGQVVTNFLNFARPAQLVLSHVDLQAVCERAADDFRAEVHSLGGELSVRGSFGTLEGDEVLLRQAFSNLLRNAVEACAAASVAPRIAVESTVDAARHVSVIAVDDNGPGIDPSARDRVFRPFYTSKRGGTGLGLAVVQKIIVFHNGRVSAGASPLGGASLRVTLPTG